MIEPSGGDKITNGGVFSADAVSFVPSTEALQVDSSLISSAGQDVSARAPFERHPAAGLLLLRRKRKVPTLLLLFFHNQSASIVTNSVRDNSISLTNSDL
jgi:hypothetical protein